MTTLRKSLWLALIASTFAVGVAEARSLKWARSGDSLTLDPHAQNEGPTHTLSHQIYEPLVRRAANTGRPHCIASRTGNPKPSLSEGKRNASQRS